METINDILTRMEAAYEAEAGHPARAVSDTGLRLRVLAGELLRLQGEIAWLRRQAFPDTATGTWLDRHGEARGVTRHPASCAVGSLTFTRYIPLSFDLELPAGTVCTSTGEDPVEFVTTADGVLAAGELNLTVPARAVLPGPGGNLTAGRVNTMVDAPEGFQYVNNPTAFTGGSDAESDDLFRARVLAAYAVPATAANAALYRSLALSVEGVASVQVVPRFNGAGTVKVYVWGTQGLPDQTLLDKVQAVLDDQREPAVAVTVVSANPSNRTVDLRLRLEDGADADRALQAVTEAITRWFAARQIGDPLYLTQLTRVVLDAAPVLQVEWPASMQDLAPSAGRMLLLSQVRPEVIS